MGKDKNVQRTKGNKKPSSSGRTAELMGGAGTFVGFTALQDLGYVPAASQGVTTDDSTISAEFRVTLRKMTKKDVTTKVKALQEFETLCETESQESIKSALPFWPRLYIKLSTDVERRVREAAQGAHGAMVIQVGKQLAPHLRTVMPSWVLAMVDPYPPAASAASRAFQEAFAPEKRAEVMIFTCKEILEHITDNLFNQTPQTLSDPKFTDPEDMEKKYIRVLYCSLKGLSLLLNYTSQATTKKSEVIDMMSPLLQDQKFWKLPKHKDPLVRSAWFSVMKDMFEYDKLVLNDYSAELSKAIIPAIDDQEGMVILHVWVAFLHLCTLYPDFWGDAALIKSLFGRIYTVLRDGGRGSATELYPQLLPIISVIPEQVMGNKRTFYIDFFRSISTGIRKEKVLCNAKEVAAILKAQFECLLYVSINYTDVQLWETLIKYQVVDTLKSSFTDMPHLSTSNLFREVAELLRSWAWKSQTEEEVKPLESLLKTFWSYFEPECEAIIREGNEKNVSRLIEFFLVLQNPTSKFATKREGVKFLEETEVTIVIRKSHGDDSEEDKKNRYFLEHTGRNVAPLILLCHSAFLQEKNLTIYKLFAVLLSSYPSQEVCTALVHGVESKKPASLKDLLEIVIQPKMEIEVSAFAQPTVDLFISLYVILDQEEQKLLLLKKPSFSVSVLRHLLEKMTERRESDPVARSWLMSPHLGNRLVHLVEKLYVPPKLRTQASQQQDELIALFNFVLRNGNKKEPVISVEYISEILVKLSTRLKVSTNEENEPDDAMVQLVANLSRQLFSSYVCWQTSGIQEFMKSLFSLLCQSSKALSLETVDMLKSTFLKAFEGLIASLAKDSPDKLMLEEGCLVSTLKDIKQTVMEDHCTFSLVITLAELTRNLFMLIYDVLVEDDCSIMLDHSKIQTMLGILIPTEGEWAEIELQMSPLYVAPCIFHGTIAFREFPFPKNMQEKISCSHKHSRLSLYLCDLLLYLCGRGNSMSLCTAEEAYVAQGEPVSLGQYTHVVVSALHSTCHAAITQELNEALSNNSVSEDIKCGTKKLKEDMKSLLSKLNQGNKRLITKQIKDRCSDGSSAWCVTLSNVLSVWMKAEDINVLRLMNSLEESALGYTATKQSLLPLLPQENLLEILTEEMGRLASLADDPFSSAPCLSLVTTALSHCSSSETKTTINALFTLLTHWREAADNIFLFASDISGMPWEDIVVTCSIVRLLTVLVKNHSVHLQPSQWDFILCSLSSWAQSLEESRKSITLETVSGAFTCAVCKCIGCVNEFMEQMSTNPDVKEKYPAKLLEDWKEFFSPSIYNSLIPIFVDVSASYIKNPSVILYGVCRAISIGVCLAGADELAAHTLPPLYTVEDAEAELKLPDAEQILLNHLCPLLVSPHPPTQCAAFVMLSSALPNIMKHWEMNQIVVREEEDTPQRPLPYAITRVIKECNTIVEATFGDKNIGEECLVLPHTDSHVFTTGYFLAWRLALSAFAYASDANQHQYSAHIRQSDLLETLLTSVFKVMPSNPTVEDGVKINQSDDKSPLTMFNTELTIHPGMSITSKMVSHLACKAYFDCVSRIPAAVRQWYIGLERRCQSVVDTFTTDHVSPLLIIQEMSAINSSSMKFNNMTIKARPGAREVVATYTIDEASMELILRMAPNHPLSTVVVEDHRRVGVSVAQWRNWLLGLNTMLSHRNTPLLQSLAFWKQNVDQKFEGIEECFICYYVLHGTNHQLPKLLCRTCKKKFHSACLYKWFNSSNNSTCPLCRSLF